MRRKLLMILSVILVFVTTIAYSALSTTLTITAEARIRPLADIRVNGIALSSTSGGATVQYESDYNKNTITSGFVLPNSGSSISYTVHVDNTGDVDYSIYDILTTSSNNQGLTYTISGYNKKDIIQAKTSLDFVITYTTTQPGEGTINVVNTLVFKKVFHITYDTQGGGTIASQIKYEDVDLTLTSTTPSKNGYTFTKWNTKQDGTGVNYLPGATYTPNEDKILYAQYNLATYNITYVLNGGTNDANNPSTYNITTNDITLGDASKTGYTFQGWTGNGTTTPTKNLVLAKGSYGDKTFTANFIDETGPTIAVTKTDGTGDYLANALNVNAGWNTSVGTISVGINAEDNGSGLSKVEYALTNSSTAPTTGWTETTNGTLNISNTARGTYYLHIKATDEDENTTTVTTKAITVRYRVGYYDDYSASTSITTSQYYTGSALTTRTPTKTGYTFEGWYSSTALTTKVVDAGVSYTPTKSIRLYGKWTATDYTISYATNNGTVSPANPDTYNIESSAITLNNPTKTLTFKGNYNATSGANASSTSGVSLGSDTSQAQTFKGWSGTGLTGDTNTSVTIAAGSTGDRSYTAHYTAVAGNTPTVTRTGYTCGWNRSNSGTTIEINSGDPYPTSYITEDMGVTVNLYAVCTPNTYSVTYDYNTGDARIGNNVYINTGYKFNWNNDFKLNSTINLPTAGQRYLLFGNYTTTSELNLELTTGNKMRVYSQGDKATSTGTLAANTDIQIEFIYTGSNKEFSLTSTGTSSNASASGTNDKSGLTGAPLRIGTDNRTNNTFKQYLLKAASITDYYDCGGTLSNLPTSPTRPGYTFGGWYTAASGGTQVTSSTSVPSANTTYYAHWTAKTYTLTINPQGGTYNSSTSNATKTMTFDSINNNDIGVPTRDGYTFAGWYTSASGGTQVYGSDGHNTTASNYWTAAYSTGKWAYDNDLTVYAKWTKAVSNLTNSVSPTSYIYSGSANSPTPTVKDGSTTLTLNTDYTVSYSNNTNVGTATATITGAGVYNSTTKAFYTGTATINYYVNNAKITYNANSCGTITGTSPAYVKKGTTGVYTGIRNTTAGTVAGITATKGYTFNGWYDGNTKVINADGTIVASVSNWTDANKKWLITEDKTLTASCIANTYTVAYNGNGNTGGSTASSSHTYDTAKALTTNGFTKTGHTFIGWSTSSSDKGIFIDNYEYHQDATSASSYINIKDYSVEPPFVSGEVYQLEFDAKGTGQLSSFFHGASGYLKVASVTNSDGYSANDHTDGHNIVNLTSSYKHYSVRFTLGSEGDGSVVKKILFRATVGNDCYVKNARFFKVSSSSTAYSDEQSVVNLTTASGATVNLYAMWKVDSHTIIYNTTENGGTGTIADATVNYGSAITLPTTGASKSGWTFVGWNTDQNATTALSSLNMGADDVTLYAIYSKTVTATFNANGTTLTGTTNPSCTYYNNATSCQVTAPTVTAQSGFTHIGFNTSSDSTSNNSDYDTSTNKLTISADSTWYPITRSSSQYTGTFTIQDSNAATMSGGATSCYRYNGGSSCNITAPTLTAESGYTVVGWNATANSTTASYAATGAVIAMTADKTFYSITKNNDSITVRFYRNAANSQVTCIKSTSTSSCSTGSYVTKSCYKYNGATSCSIATPFGVSVTSGYHFKGFSTSATEDVNLWGTYKTYSASSSHYRYGRTVGNTYSIVFNANCPSGSTASGTMSDQSMVYGTAANLTSNAYSCTGNIFSGWNSAADGTGTDYTNGQSVTNLTTTSNGTYNLYGVWIKVWAENISYDNTDSGVNCTDAQCMLDYLSCRIKDHGTCTTPLHVGDYVQMTPNPGTLDSNNRYELPTSKTGYSSVQYQWPKELKLWRVIKVNANGTAEMISEYTSSREVYFSGSVGYANFTGYLNTLANQYQNPAYTIGARNVGYHGQTQIISDTSKFDGTYNAIPWTDSMTYAPMNIKAPNEALGQGDTLYAYDTLTDTGLVQLAYGNQGSSSLVALRCDDINCNNPTNAGQYWLSSRSYMYNGEDAIFQVFMVGSQGYEGVANIRSYSSGSWSNGSMHAYIRPIVVVKDGVTIASGDGTKASPYVFN